MNARKLIDQSKVVYWKIRRPKSYLLSYTKRVQRYWKRQLHLLHARTRAVIHCNVFRYRKLLDKKLRHRPIVAISLIEHFGDIVACEPVSRYVRAHYPDAYIIWFVKAPYAELLQYNPHIDELIQVYCLTEWMHFAKSCLFDKIIDLHLQHRECEICEIPLNKQHVHPLITLKNYYYHGNLLSVFCESAGLPRIDKQPRVYIDQHVRKRVNSFSLPDKYVVFHCLSNDSRRDWQPAKWVELARIITKTFELPIVEVGLKPLVKELHCGMYIDLCGKLSLLETAEIIRSAEFFVGVDSGPAHLANAVGTFGIILIGQLGNFNKYMPYSGSYQDGRNACIIYGDGPLSLIPVEQVSRVIADRLRQVT